MCFLLLCFLYTFLHKHPFLKQNHTGDYVLCTLENRLLTYYKLSAIALNIALKYAFLKAAYYAFLWV